MPCSKFLLVLPVEKGEGKNTRYMVFDFIFLSQIIKKSEFDHFFTV
jgi:hypothetical protein